MKLTKQALRGVIKEVLKEANGPAEKASDGDGLRAGKRKRVGRTASVAGARTGQAECIGSQEVTVAEVDVLEAVVAKLREIAASPGVNMAGGGMIQLLERLLKLLGLKAKGGFEADEVAAPAPDAPAPDAPDVDPGV